ncbi:MFS transporter, partial [uncultured Microbacterium sp.]
MSDGAAATRTSATALLVAVLLVAANMRPTITSVGPLIPQIGVDTGLSPAALGVLAAVPLLAWGLVSPFAHALTRRFGMARTVLWALVLLTAGTLVRSFPGPTLSLWLGTILIGGALAVVNVLMPAFIKRDFVRVPLVMALYTALLGGVGALASGVAVPVSQVGAPDAPAGWRFALVVIGCALLPFAIAAWAWTTRGTDALHRSVATERSADPDAPPPVTRTAIWRDPLAWQVAGYMGLQSASFYMLVTWLATFSTSVGRSDVVAGIDVMVYQIFALVGSLSVPLLLRGRGARVAPAALPLLGIAGTVGLLAVPDGIDAWVAAIGLYSGASLGMSLTLIAQRARDHDASAALSGMAQAVGYFIAASGPVLFGSLHAASGGWILPFALLVAVMVGQGVVGAYAGRDRFVLDRR